MGAYITRRLLLMVPTLFGIMLVTFAILQFVPGGPIDRIIAELQGENTSATERFGGSESGDLSRQQNGSGGDSSVNSRYRGAQGLDPEFILELERQFGLDRPAHERFGLLLWNYLRFDFGESYFKKERVVDLIIDKLPVSASLGLWMLFISYGISIPLGIRKAVRDGSKFDIWTSSVVAVGYAVPGFLFGVFLIITLAGADYANLFPLRGLTSDNWDELSLGGKVLDYLWHLALPVASMAIGAFATVTLLTKNSFLDEIRKQYVLTARAKGLAERRVLYGHVFRNAMLIIIAGFPGAFISAFFASSLLIENLFSLDGLGLLTFEAVFARDYPIVLANLYIFGLMSLVMHLLSDLTYMWIDPRIDFESREV